MTRSNNYYAIPYKIIGINEAPGNGKMLNVLRENFAEIKRELGDNFKNTVFLVTAKDSTVVVREAEKTLEIFFSQNCDVFFAARKPFAGELKHSFFTSSPYKILRTDVFIAKSQALEKILFQQTVEESFKEGEADLEDTVSEKYFTEVFFKNFEFSNASLNVEVDFNCDLFQSFYQAVDEMKMSGYNVENVWRTKKPSVLISDAGYQADMRYFSDRTAAMRVEPDFSRYSSKKIDRNNYPHVFLCFYFLKPNFVSHFLESVVKFDYPKDRITLYFAANQETITNYLFSEIDKFISEYSGEYLNFEFNFDFDKIVKAKDYFMQKSLSFDCDYYFYLDSRNIITKTDVLESLISSGKEIVAPLVINSLLEPKSARNFQIPAFAPISSFTHGTWSIYSAEVNFFILFFIFFILFFIFFILFFIFFIFINFKKKII